jgi:hypothetical protein
VACDRAIRAVEDDKGTGKLLLWDYAGHG